MAVVLRTCAGSIRGGQAMRIDYHEHAEITRPMGALSAAATADTLEPALLELVKDSLCGRPEELGAWRIAVLREQSGTGGSK
jgi:hypothetical protein